MTEPLRRSLRVRCPVARAFEVFTSRVDQWWPPGHRRSQRSELVLEGKVGGRFFERDEAGSEVELGEVLLWEPPTRLRYSWRPGSSSGPTEVEVCFRGEGDVTLVEVTHSAGRIGPDWAERVQRFERAWAVVLPAYGALAGSQV
jgi:uncharacterized protein YndB with AHSA1/START domain